MNLTEKQAEKALKLFDKLFYDEITECEEGKRILSIIRNEENERIVDFLFSALSIRIAAIEDYYSFRECATYGTEILMKYCEIK